MSSVIETAEKIVLAAGAWAFSAAVAGAYGPRQREPEVVTVATDILAGRWDRAAEAMGQAGVTGTIGCEILTEYLGLIEAETRTEYR